MIFTKVVATVLRHTRSIGFYMPARSLLLSKEFYLHYTDLIHEGHLPLFNWVHFVSFTNNTTNSHSYCTIGMYCFNKKEIEIEDSFKPTRDLAKIMIDTVNHVLSNDAVLKDGETIELPEGHIIDVRMSKGVRVKGDIDTVKLLY